MDISYWVYLLIFTAFVSAAVKRLCPSRFSAFAGYICSLCVISVTLCPLSEMTELISKASDIAQTVINSENEEYIYTGSRLVEEETHKVLSEKIGMLIEEKTEVKGFECVCLERFSQGGVLSSVSVKLHPDGYSAYTVLKLKEESLEEWLCGILCCDVEISIDEKP